MSTSTMESPDGRRASPPLSLSPLPPPRRNAPEHQPPPPGALWGPCNGSGGALVARAAPALVGAAAGPSLQQAGKLLGPADADFFEAMFEGGPLILTPAHQDAIDLLKSGKALDAAERKATYAAAEDHTAVVNKKLDLLELEVAHVSLPFFFLGRERVDRSARRTLPARSFLLTPPSPKLSLLSPPQTNRQNNNNNNNNNRSPQSTTRSKSRCFT